MNACSIEGCKRPGHARGLCGAHYQRLRTTGTTDLAPRPSLEDRFWLKVAKSAGCWLWTGAANPAGYGVINTATSHPERGSETMLAHRVSWCISRGPIPDGLFVCHTCDNPPCVNPAHLFLGTNADNISDMVRKGRSQRNRPHGDAHSKAKLTTEQVLRIRALCDGGARPIDLAPVFGVAPNTISAIALHRTWQHI